jgi:hypothetical protein
MTAIGPVHFVKANGRFRRSAAGGWRYGVWAKMPPTRPSVDDEPDGPVENITVEKMG